MKINLTKKQYVELLETSYLARFMIEAYQLDTGERYAETDQHLLSHAQDFGYKAEEDSDLNQRFVNDETAEPLHRLIGEYNDCVFWEELVLRLASRDLARKLGQEALESLSPEEYESRLEPLMEAYRREFEDNGQQNLTAGINL